MSENVGREGANRLNGTVVQVIKDYGFVSCPEVPEQDLYFKSSWFRGSPPLREGEDVTFELKRFGTPAQAHYLLRVADSSVGTSDRMQAPSPKRSTPTKYLIFDWAYLGYLPNALSELSGLALPERWEFQNAARDPEHPVPILYSYLVHTFGRLVRERKVFVHSDATWAAFNTGLVDPRY